MKDSTFRQWSQSLFHGYVGIQVTLSGDASPEGPPPLASQLLLRDHSATGASVGPLPLDPALDGVLSFTGLRG